MASKLHMVTLVRSPIGKPNGRQMRRTLEALGLTRLQKTVVHKNTSTINGMLRSVVKCVDVRPYNPRALGIDTDPSPAEASSS